MKRYPMKLKPALKEIIWGGDKLKKSYNKHTAMDLIAESWELTVRPDGMNEIANGEAAGMTLGAYLEQNPDAIGEHNTSDRFPLLIKLIDAHDRLSIQVHPSDDYALKHENEFGKTEMWYIVEADEGAELVFGLSRDYTPEAFDAAIANGRVEKLLNRVKVHAGEVYFIPSGLVHAIGAGILICEIQQSSNVTYRVYDYNRAGKDGKPRELHVEKARDVIVNYTPAEIEALRYAALPAGAAKPEGLLASCDKFTVMKYAVHGSSTIDAGKSSFVSLTFTDGSGSITCPGKTYSGKTCSGESYPFVKGDTYFLPAGLGTVTIHSESAVCIAASL